MNNADAFVTADVKHNVFIEAASKNYTLIEATLHTGKTHQLRLHFDYLGHNIIGDELYGNDDEKILYLHSYYLKFVHPVTLEEIEIKSIPSWLS